MNKTFQRQAFVKTFVEFMREGNAALFVGAGMSQPAGVVDWKGLLKDAATELGLDIDEETDLIALAQFHEIKHRNRYRIERLIIDKFTQGKSPTENHGLLARLPIDTVWTTNYDQLLEEAFRAAHRKVDVKVTSDSLQHSLPDRSVTVYKMHGDVQLPGDAVLTKKNYEEYEDTHELYLNKLKSDIVSKTFLFLGFSFTDPNIDYILSRIRALRGASKRQHYTLMRWPPKPQAADFSDPVEFEKAKQKNERERVRLELRIEDLKRYGIEALMIDDFAEITEVLMELNRQVHLRDVCVSGSAAIYDPLGEPAVTELCRLLGQRLIAERLNLVSGLGVGIGDKVVIGALETLYQKHYYDASDRLFLRPFPQAPPAGMTIQQFWTKYRQDMLARAGSCIFICGNKLDKASNTVVEANGVWEEFQIAEQQGLFPIPVGATGHTAKRIWEHVNKDLTRYFPQGGVEQHFATLGKDTSTPVQLVDAVICILKQIKAI